MRQRHPRVSDGSSEGPCRPHTQAPAKGLLWLALSVLLGMGLVLVYSSSSVYAGRVFQDPQHFLKAQLLWVASGIVALLGVACVPRACVRKLCGWLFCMTLLVCTLVLIPGVGRHTGGARRWLSLGVGSFQPSDLARFSAVLMLAFLLSRPVEPGRALRRRLMGAVLLMQLPVGLILAEPDLGTAVVMELLTMVMVFAAGLRLRVLVLSSLAALPVVYHLVVGTPFRLRRLLGYLDPWAYRSTVGYQVTEALISMGSGGLWGVGLGEGKQKLFFLPEAHNDFIFAILGEELGWVGVGVLLTAFGVVVGCGIRLATCASDSFDAYVALGVTALIGIPAVLNAAVATGLLPTKGLSLPFISYGGSNMVVSLASMGLLLRMDQRLRQTPRGGT